MKEKGFKSLVTLEEARDKFFSSFDTVKRTTTIPLTKAGGRITAEEILALRPAPHYRRAAMDGFAVVASDTFGASQSSPNRIRVGEKVEPGVATPVHTGGLVPEEADGVLKIEETKKGANKKLDVYSSVAPGDNVSPVGEDVKKGDTLLEKGNEINPAHLGLLRSLGVEEVPVAEKPVITIIPTGEELVSPGEEPGPGQTIQSNGIMIAEYARSWGGSPVEDEVLSDQPDDLKKALSQKVEGSDAIVFTGGSSVGRRDRLVEVLEEEGEVLVHGVAIQPGKPLGLAVVEEVPVIALPGYPVATLAGAYFFLKPLIAHMTGWKAREKTTTVQVAKKIHSTLGRLSLVRVTVTEGKAYPIRVSGSGVLSSVTRSDGFVLIPKDSEGLATGKETELHYWR
ncbi:MAG: gephyrin-like molybdotransferase Glp [Candidatus Bipolaricaulota bacterium]